MRMDLVKSRYATYDELYDYCYRVAGTVRRKGEGVSRWGWKAIGMLPLVRRACQVGRGRESSRREEGGMVWCGGGLFSFFSEEEA